MTHDKIPVVMLREWKAKFLSHMPLFKRNTDDDDEDVLLNDTEFVSYNSLLSDWAAFAVDETGAPLHVPNVNYVFNKVVCPIIWCMSGGLLPFPPCYELFRIYCALK
jgi:hypothetical protein